MESCISYVRYILMQIYILLFLLLKKYYGIYSKKCINLEKILNLNFVSYERYKQLYFYLYYIYIIYFFVFHMISIIKFQLIYLFTYSLHFNITFYI